MRSFVSKPVQILGKQFDGTRESAKEITDWIKSDPNVNYHSAELREAVSKFGFESSVSLTVDARCYLTIHTATSQYHVTKDDWLILYVEDGTYSTSSDRRLHEIYAEL